MVQRNGMLGLVRFRMLRAGISKYSTLRLASSSSLSAASLAIPTRAMVYLRLLFAFWQEEFWAAAFGRFLEKLAMLTFLDWSAQASDSFHESVDPNRGVLAFTASRSLPLVEFACPPQCVVTKRMEPGARQLLLVVRHVLFAIVVERSPLNVGALIAKVQQCPQFKTRIGNRQLDPVGSGLLLCFRDQSMLVDIKNTPDLIVSEVRVPLAPCKPLGVFLLLNSPLYQSLWHAARTDFQFYEAMFQVAGLPKVSGLRLCALANDQEPRKARPGGSTKSAAAAAIFRRTICACTSGWAAPGAPIRFPFAGRRAGRLF